jgi:hypothetical protein
MKQFDIERLISNPTLSLGFATDPTPPATKLVIVFNGMGFSKFNKNSEMNIDPVTIANLTSTDTGVKFELYKTLTSSDILTDFDSLFIADFNRMMYMNGIKGITDSPEETTDLLIEFIKRKQYTSIYLTGSCAGGNQSIYQACELKKSLENTETNVTEIKVLVFNGFVRMSDNGYYNKWVHKRTLEKHSKYLDISENFKSLDNSISPQLTIKFVNDTLPNYIFQPSLLEDDTNQNLPVVITDIIEGDEEYKTKADHMVARYLKTNNLLAPILNEFLGV